MSVRTPIHNGLLQSDLDTNGFDILGFSGGGGGGGGLPEGWVSVMDYGAVADGVTDNTAAVQAAVAAATSVVYFPPGNYLFSGNIGVIPPAISLVGANHFGPNWYVYYTAPLASGGTVLMLTAGSGSGSGTPFITATSNTAIVGFSFYWPNQLASGTTPIAYPYAIRFHDGNASSVRFCQFVNAYQGIYLETTLDNLIEEVRGEILYRGIKMEGNASVTRLRGVYFDNQWTTGNSGGMESYRANNAIAFDFGYNDMTILESCFAVYYNNWIRCYNDVAHGGSNTAWLQVIGGGGDLCAVPVSIEYSGEHGVEMTGVSLTCAGAGACLAVAATNTGSVRVHSSLFFSGFGRFAVVNGSGQVTVDDTYHFGTIGGGIGPESFPSQIGWDVSGTGNFAMRDCHFRTDQPHVALAATVAWASIIGNLCTGTFNVTNNMTVGHAVIDNNSGGDTRYIGSDARLVAVSGGVKLEVRNTGTGTWVEATRYTNP